MLNTHYYFDEEAKQGRDIDIYAMPIALPLLQLEDKLKPFGLRTELAIECKKSMTHAWFFYTRPHIPISSLQISGQIRTSVPEPVKFSTDSFQWLLKNDCFVLHYDKFDKVSVAYEEIKKRKMEKGSKDFEKQTDVSGRKEIFEAKNQLVKFVCYEIHETFNRLSKLPKDTASRELVIALFPIIVFDGDMFEVSFHSGEPKLEKKNQILLSTSYRCPYCSKVENFIIDVVHRSYFPQFLEILGTCFRVIRENMLKNHEELTKRARETRIRSEQEKGDFLFV